MTKRDGVHLTHCCPIHGCKYGAPDCPVATFIAEPTGIGFQECCYMTYMEDLPKGFSIVRVNRDRAIKYSLLEDGIKWPSGEPRSTLTVSLSLPEPLLGLAGYDLSWPSTSDHRPDLARALAAALRMAADEHDARTKYR